MKVTLEPKPEAKVVAQSRSHVIPALVEIFGVDQLGTIRIPLILFQLVLNLMMMMMMMRG